NEILARAGIFQGVEPSAVSSAHQAAEAGRLPARAHDIRRGRARRTALHHRLGKGQDRAPFARMAARTCSPSWGHRTYSGTPSPPRRITNALAQRVQTFVLTADTERLVLVARLTGLDDVDVIGAEDVPDISGNPATPSR